MSDWGTAVKDGLRSIAYLTSIAHFQQMQVISRCSHPPPPPPPTPPPLFVGGGFSLDDGQLGRSAETCPSQLFSSHMRQEVSHSEYLHAAMVACWAVLHE